MDQKKILLIIALIVLILGTITLVMRTKDKPSNNQNPAEKLTDEQKEFADDFSKAMQEAKNETKK